MNEDRVKWMREAIQAAEFGLRSGAGGPFGAVVVKNGRLISKGWNQVTSSSDPTAHAEVVAIREACRRLGTFQLTGCELYTTCEPCPMCLGAIYWARPDRFWYACNRADAAAGGFDDSFIYEELTLDPVLRRIESGIVLREEASMLFDLWRNMPDKIDY